MYPTVRNIAIDCVDPYALATFWSKVVGQPLAEDDLPGDPEASVQLPGGPALFFAAVPEPKVGKNRLHICLEPSVPREDEVERILALGATMVHDRRKPDGRGWAVLADPDGNEFCVLRSAAERAAGQNAQQAASDPA
ncbi:VOC family protein [Micromonospora sp. DT229]|uniref:VOC family protein n=1 Tax=Micromonospora sp. DT229 TaxID=3393430 RepID=UPI003CEA4C5B